MGEVEIKVSGLVEEVFTKYGGASAGQEEAEMNKEQIKEFLKQLMTEAGETEAWDDLEFDNCFKEFDYDGSGNVNKQELTNFIKRFAAL